MSRPEQIRLTLGALEEVARDESLRAGLPGAVILAVSSIRLILAADADAGLEGDPTLEPREQYACTIGRDDVASGEVWLEPDAGYVEWLEEERRRLLDSNGAAAHRIVALAGQLELAEQLLDRRAGGVEERTPVGRALSAAVERLIAEEYGPPPHYPSTPTSGERDDMATPVPEHFLEPLYPSTPGEPSPYDVVAEVQYHDVDDSLSDEPSGFERYLVARHHLGADATTEEIVEWLERGGGDE